MCNRVLFLSLMVFVEGALCLFATETRNATYEWRTGPWGSCFSPTGCGEGRRERRVSCIEISGGLVLPESDCDIEKRPATWEPCFRVCESHKAFLRWSSGPWSPCITRKHPRANCESPAVGLATRKVVCLFRVPDDRLEVIVDHEACDYFWNRPDSSMACSFDCPQNCVVSKPEESACSATSCQAMEQNDPSFFQRIVVAPQPGGRPCPASVDEVSPCFSVSNCTGNNTLSKNYVLKVDSWSPCLPETSHLKRNGNLTELASIPQIGRTRRELTCLDHQGIAVDISFCGESSERAVDREQRCLVPVDCELSPWTLWTVEREGCINSERVTFPEVRTRRRRLVRIALGNGEPCGPLYEKRIISQNLPPCNKYKWYPLEWSDCAVYTHEPGQVIVHKVACGGGIQVRNIICLRITDQIPVADSFCKEPKPPELERCEVPCAIDCQVSHWSAWGPCLPHDPIMDYFEHVESGYTKRSRSVVVTNSHGGQFCPHLEEQDTCDNVEVTRLIYSNWSECVLQDPDARCGVGNITRDFTCLSWKGNELGKHLCHRHIPLIETITECHIPCPNDCLVLEWSDWSTCSMPCYTELDRWGYKYRNRTRIAIRGPGGRHCSEENKEKEYCNLVSCSLLFWNTSEWGPCKFESDSKKCGNGTQKRTLYCTKDDYKFKDHTNCKHLEKPTDSKECFIPCPEDCVLTKFTQWTNCSSEPEALQQRERFIGRSAKHGGVHCPDKLVETRPCDTRNKLFLKKKRKPLTSHFWQIGPWGECILPVITDPCGKGFQARNVSCVDDSKRVVEMHLCTNEIQVSDDTMPLSFRLCQVICHNNSACVLSSWTSWSSCHHSYKAKRVRTRELLGGSVNEIYCTQHFSLVEEENCPYLSLDSNGDESAQWSSCIVKSPNQTAVGVNGRLVSNSCGPGYRYKAGLQLQKGNEIEHGLEEDLCLEDCPIDCKMSPWTDWSECDRICGHGIMQRKRFVLIEANQLGRGCPPGVTEGTEVESQVCGSLCLDYVWHKTSWTICHISLKNSKCGSGVRYRTISCIEKIKEVEVPEEWCDPRYHPESVEDCYVFCPGECVVSLWEISKPCLEPCQVDDYQEKRRHILRQPNELVGQGCPSLVVREPCIANQTCFNYSWKISQWSSCILHKDALCGKGIQKRSLMCIRSDGWEVDTTHCEKVPRPSSFNKPLSKPCYADCPIDCIVSEWSEWDASQCQLCGSMGMMSRQRTVLQPPSEYGQSCPNNLVQEKPCTFKPCYHWNTSEWSECILQDADCGFGVRRRLVRCLRYDGLQVSKVHCLSVNITFEIQSWLDPRWLILSQGKAEEEECYIRCPGDCLYSQWSEWSHCNRDCAVGQKVGYQSSSRVLLMPLLTQDARCNGKLWRTLPCWEGECFTFSWKFRNKTLTCVRSDGLEVTGACIDQPKYCFKHCESINGAKCDSSLGLCYCQNRNGHRIILYNLRASSRCVHGLVESERNPKRPSNHTALNSETNLRYYPDDSQASFWMYAMISIGTAFVIFVVVTIYLMCRSTIRQRMVSVHRQGSLRRKTVSNNLEAENNMEVQSNSYH